MKPPAFHVSSHFRPLSCFQRSRPSLHEPEMEQSARGPSDHLVRYARLILGIIVCLSLAGCAKIATVKEIKLSAKAGAMAKSADPMEALAEYLEAAETAWIELARDPADNGARRKYNFAVA